ELHAVFPRLGLAFARFERGMCEKARERIEPFGFIVHETASGTDELFQVLDARLALFAFLFFVMLDQAAHFEHVLDLLAKLKRRRLAREALDEIEEAAQRLRRARRELAAREQPQ